MKKIIYLMFISIIILGTPLCIESTNDFNKLKPVKDPYFGLKPPGDIPVLFAPGIISTKMNELNSIFTPDGSEFYFSIQLHRGLKIIMMEMKKINNIWTKPEVLPFSGKYSDADQFISYDNQKLFFVSNRPINSDLKNNDDWNIWVVNRENNSWGEPVFIKELNTSSIELYPSVSRNGNIYFSSNRKGGFGSNDIYRAEWEKDHFLKPVNIGSPVNSKHREGDVFIAADETYLIFACSSRPDSVGGGDLYISFNKGNEKWTKPINMGNKVNSKEYEYCPVVSPDGRYLFFTSFRTTELIADKKYSSLSQINEAFEKIQNGLGNIYWVDAKIIEELKPKKLK